MSKLAEIGRSLSSYHVLFFSFLAFFIKICLWTIVTHALQLHQFQSHSSLSLPQWSLTLSWLPVYLLWYSVYSGEQFGLERSRQSVCRCVGLFSTTDECMLRYYHAWLDWLTHSLTHLFRERNLGFPSHGVWNETTIFISLMTLHQNLMDLSRSSFYELILTSS